MFAIELTINIKIWVIYLKVFNDIIVFNRFFIKISDFRMNFKFFFK